MHAFGAKTTNDQSLPGTDSQRPWTCWRAASRRSRTAQPHRVPRDARQAHGRRDKKAIDASFAAIKKQPHVYSAVDPLTQQGQGYLSKDKRTAFIPVLMDVTPASSPKTQAARVLAAAAPGRAAGMQVAAGGPSAAPCRSPRPRSARSSVWARPCDPGAHLRHAGGHGHAHPHAVIGLVVGLSIVGLVGHLISIPTVGTTLAIMIAWAWASTTPCSWCRGTGPPGRRAGRARGHRAHRGGRRRRWCSPPATVMSPWCRSPWPASRWWRLSATPPRSPCSTAVLAAVTLLPAAPALAGNARQRAAPARLPARRPPPGPQRAGALVGLRDGTTGNWPWPSPWPCWRRCIIPMFSLRLGQEDVGVTPHMSTTERQALFHLSPRASGRATTDPCWWPPR